MLITRRGLVRAAPAAFLAAAPLPRALARSSADPVLDALVALDAAMRAEGWTGSRWVVSAGTPEATVVILEEGGANAFGLPIGLKSG